MKCSKCGMELGQNDMFCSNCGEAVQKESVNSEAKNMYDYERNTYQQQAQQINYNNRPQGMNYGQQPYQEKDNTKLIRICVIVALAVFIIATLSFIGWRIFKSAKKKEQNMNAIGSLPTTTGTTTGTSTGGTSTIGGTTTGGNTTVSTGNTNSTYKVNFEGFKFYIPNDLIYSVEESSNNEKLLAIYDEEDGWLAYGLVKNAYFNTLKANRSAMATNFTQNGYKCNNLTVENIEGVEFIVVELEYGGEKLLTVYAGLNGTYCIGFEIMDIDGTYNRDALKELAAIISNAEYTGKSSYIKSDSNIDFSGVSKKVFEELGKEQ